MVFENIFKIETAKRRPFISFFYSIIFTILALFAALMFFRHSLSLTTMFIITVLLIPTLMKLLSTEERREGRFGLKHFFKNHKDIAEIYLFSFLGVLVGYILIGLFLQASPVYSDVFSFQQGFLEQQEGLDEDLLFGLEQETPSPAKADLWGILSSNLSFVVVCFIFSFFYGASAIFLLILNASVLASFLLFLLRKLATDWVATVKVFLFFLIHLIPEVSGLLLAAIAGGVLSKAVTEEKRDSKQLKNVAKDASILLVIAVSLILIGALLEVFVTANLFHYLL